jgi:hypothetical protein
VNGTPSFSGGGRYNDELYVIIADQAGTAVRPLRVQRGQALLVERVDHAADCVLIGGDQPGDRRYQCPLRRRHYDHRPAVRAKQDPSNLTARRWAFGLLVALLAQFGVGMYVNLFTRIPLNHPGHGAHNDLTGTFHSVAWAETSQRAPVILATHAGLGLLLVVGSPWLAALAVRGRSGRSPGPPSWARCASSGRA